MSETSEPNRYTSSRIQSCTLSAEFYSDVNIKVEPEFEIPGHFEETEHVLNDFVNVDDCYCRLCFKIFAGVDNRIELDDEFMSKLRELLKLNLRISNGSRWICSECSTTVNSFFTFKEDIVKKQGKFIELLQKNEHLDLEKLQQLYDNPLSDECKIFQVKEELEDDLIDCNVQSPSRKKLTKTKSVKMNNKLPTVLKSTSSNKKKADKKEVPITVLTKNRIVKSHVPAEKVMKKTRSRCAECLKETTNLPLHKVTKHGYKLLSKCRLCSYSDFDRKKVHYHFNRKHLGMKRKRRTCEIPQVCPHCANKYTKLDEHINTVHLKILNFFCDLCDFGSYRRNALVHHMLTIHLPKSAACSQCNFVTSTSNLLQHHIKNRHEIKETDYACSVPECTKRFKTINNMQTHVKRCHEGAFDYRCDYPNCGKCFINPSERKTHIQNSHEPKNLMCDACGASFSSPAMLKKHSQMHREPKLECTQENCNKKFRNQSLLTTHVKRYHLKYPRHKCNDCDVAFYYNHDLERHVATKHLGIKYPCQVPGCESKLSRRDAYALHLKLSHPCLSGEDRKFYIQKIVEYCERMNIRLY